MEDKYSLILENPNTLMCNTNPMQTTVDSHYNKLLEPSEITLLYRNFVISRLQNNKIQRNFELWDQENYCYIEILLYQCSL